MKPPAHNREEFDFEQVDVNDFIVGKIEDIAYDPEHKTTWNGETKIRFCVRFKFKLEGYEFPHYSRWETFTYGEKGNLYKKYLSHLVEGAYPDMDFDLDLLKGMKVKTMWAEKRYEENGNEKVFQSIELIRPIEGKIKQKQSVAVQADDDIDLDINVEEPPF